MHVDDIFAVGRKERCDRLCADLNRAIPVKNLGQLTTWYGRCPYSRDRKRGTLTISQESFAEELVKKFDVTSVRNVPLRVGLKLDEFDEDEKAESWPFRELVGGLMWLAISTRPDISKAVRSVARYCSTPKVIHCKATLRILAYISGTSGFGITYQRGTLGRIFFEVFADEDYASKATDRRSVSGGAIMVGEACVCWKEKVGSTRVEMTACATAYILFVLFISGVALLRTAGETMLPASVSFQRVGGDFRRFRPRGCHQNSPVRGWNYMFHYMVGQLAPNSSHSTRGLVKCVPGKSIFRAILSPKGDKFRTRATRMIYYVVVVLCSSH